MEARNLHFMLFWNTFFLEIFQFLTANNLFFVNFGLGKLNQFQNKPYLLNIQNIHWRNYWNHPSHFHPMLEHQRWCRKLNRYSCSKRNGSVSQFLRTHTALHEQIFSLYSTLLTTRQTKSAVTFMSLVCVVHTKLSVELFFFFSFCFFFRKPSSPLPRRYTWMEGKATR